MSKWGEVNYKDLLRLRDNMENFLKSNEILEDVAKELTARLLGKVIPRTPVGQYPKSSGKVGGTLRRGWTAGSHESAMAGKNVDVVSFVQNLEMNVSGDYVEVDIINPVEYALYVEAGHRTSNHRGWVPGRHMLRISVDELRTESPKIIKNRLEKELKEVFR